MKAKIDDLVAEHSIFHSRGQLGHTDYTEAERAVLPPARHSWCACIRAPSARRSTWVARLPHRRLADAGRPAAAARPDGARHSARVRASPQLARRRPRRSGTTAARLHRGRPYDDAAHPRDLRRVTTKGTPNPRWAGRRRLPDVRRAIPDYPLEPAASQSIGAIDRVTTRRIRRL